MNATLTRPIAPAAAELRAAVLAAIRAEPAGWSGLGWDRITLAQQLGCTPRQAAAALRQLAAEGLVWNPRPSTPGIYALDGVAVAEIEL